MFATARGGVRRNELSDFVNVNQNGKIAMKFEGEDAGDRLIGVGVCSEEQDVLLATRQRPRHPLPGRDRARLRRAAPRPACAASRWPRATR